MTRSARPASAGFLTILAFIAFVSLGLPDTLLGVAWPSIRTTFDRPIGSVGWLLTFFTCGYLSSSFFGGTLLKHVGVGPVLAGSCLLVTLSLGTYALSPVWPGLFIGALLGGLGAGAIDAGINAFGARAFSPRVMNWLHGFWGVGATIGPAVMTAYIANHLGWRWGYGTIAIVMIAMTTLFFATRNAWKVDAAQDDAATAEPEHGTLLEALSHRAVIGQTLFFFLYVGFEAGAGTWLYTLLHVSRGMDAALAGGLVSGYWASLTLGRLVFGQLAHTLGPMTILRIGLSGATIGATLLFRSFPPAANIAGAAILGFSLAPVFPTMMSLTPARVGERHASHSVGFQVSAASLGIALLPGSIGLLAERWSIEILPVVLLCLAGPLIVLNEWLARAEWSRRGEAAKSREDRLQA